MSVVTFKKRCCLECGAEFAPAARHGEFCSATCRRGFNNRRAVRGAELYDLFMVLRYERSIAIKLGVWKLLCRMAMGFRQEDERERAGRKSWRPAGQVLARHPHLHATTLTNNIAGVRRRAA